MLNKATRALVVVVVCFFFFFFFYLCIGAGLYLRVAS